jgi:peptidoglycan/xylan/chitin deacetylase (PgdA/CDA1 family)
MLVAAGCMHASASRGPISSGCTNRRAIALTFDDGPNPPYTDRVLDILQREHVPATFFVEGEAVAAAQDTVRREVSLGMAVGNHSNAHDGDYADQNAEDIAADLQQADDAIAAATGERPRVYRSPYGRWSSTMFRVLHDDGYAAVGWDTDSEDWDPATSTEKIIENVAEKAHPGAIILLHDGGLGGGDPDRSRTIAALPEIISRLRDDGYAFLTVPEIIGLGGATEAGAAPQC